jgi:hypothetical protein
MFLIIKIIIKYTNSRWETVSQSLRFMEEKLHFELAATLERQVLNFHDWKWQLTANDTNRTE